MSGQPENGPARPAVDAPGVLRAARELLADPERWTQHGWFARDANGVDVASTSPAAVRWCVQGAVSKVIGDPDYPVLPLFDGALPEQTTVSRFNDTATHEELLALIDRAILLAVQRQSATWTAAKLAGLLADSPEAL